MVKRKPEASASWEDKRYFAQWNILHISRSQRQGDKIVNEIIETRLAAMKVNTSMTPLWQPSARHVDAAPFIHHSLNAHAVHKAVYTQRTKYICMCFGTISMHLHVDCTRIASPPSEKSFRLAFTLPSLRTHPKNSQTKTKTQTRTHRQHEQLQQQLQQPLLQQRQRFTAECLPNAI